MLGFTGSLALWLIMALPALKLTHHCSSTLGVLLFFTSSSTLMIIVTGNNASQIDRLVSTLGSEFALKDLGGLHHFLGIEVISSGSDITLS